MICGTLQTLNEEAFEDVIGSERPSPTGEGIMIQQLAPIREGSELNSTPDDNSSVIGFIPLDYNNKRSNSYTGDTLPTIIVMPSEIIDDTRL